MTFFAATSSNQQRCSEHFRRTHVLYTQHFNGIRSLLGLFELSPELATFACLKENYKKPYPFCYIFIFNLMFYLPEILNQLLLFFLHYILFFFLKCIDYRRNLQLLILLYYFLITNKNCFSCRFYLNSFCFSFLCCFCFVCAF